MHSFTHPLCAGTLPPELPSSKILILHPSLLQNHVQSLLCGIGSPFQSFPNAHLSNFISYLLCPTGLALHRPPWSWVWSSSRRFRLAIAPQQERCGRGKNVMSMAPQPGCSCPGARSSGANALTCLPPWSSDYVFQHKIFFFF